MPVDSRSLTLRNFMLNLDGKPAGFVRSVEGGDATADVVVEMDGNKRLGNLRYEPLTMQVDLTLMKALYGGMMNSQRKNGSITTLDANFKGLSELEFSDALITEITIPKMDGGSKEAGLFSVKMQPETTRLKRSSSAPKVTAPKTSKAKSWLTANFRLAIDGLDGTRVSKIDALTIKQTVTDNPVGEMRDPRREPGKLEFPNLRVYVAESQADSWYDWHESFVMQGKNDEKTGTLELLSADLKTRLAQIKFFNLGIFKLAPEKVEAGGEAMRRLVAEMYCERMEFEMLTK